MDVELDPTIHGVFGDALAFVDQAADDDLPHHAQTRAGGAGSRRLVEREVGHAHLWHCRAAMRAGKSPIGAFVGFVLPVFGRGLKGGRRHILPALRAGTMSEAGVQHPQIGEYLGGCTNRRAGAVIRQVLVHADGGGQADDGIHRRFGQSPGDHAERFHVLALTFLVQDVKGQGGFPRTRHPVRTTSLFLGISRVTFLRLCRRALRIVMVAFIYSLIRIVSFGSLSKLYNPGVHVEGLVKFVWGRSILKAKLYKRNG